MSIPNISSYTLPNDNEILANKVDWAIDKKHTALLIHDMQKYFIQFYGKDNPLIDTVVNNMVKITDFCRVEEIPIFYTAQPASQTIEERALLNDMWGSGISNLPHLQDIITKLSPKAVDTVLVKLRYSAFQRNNFEALLKQRQIKQLMICGVYANIGCLTTAIDAFMRDIKPFIVRDAVADFSREEHINALNYIATKVGSVISTEQILTSE